jgi:hypothetical protein
MISPRRHFSLGIRFLERAETAILSNGLIASDPYASQRFLFFRNNSGSTLISLCGLS